jgi:hypothetical protein
MWEPRWLNNAMGLRSLLQGQLYLYYSSGSLIDLWEGSSCSLLWHFLGNVGLRNFVCQFADILQVFLCLSIHYKTPHLTGNYVDMQEACMMFHIAVGIPVVARRQDEASLWSHAFYYSSIYIKSIVTELWAGESGFSFQRGQRIFVFTIMSTSVLLPTQPWIQWVPEESFFTGHEADHSSPSVAKVKNVWSCTSTLPYGFTVWCIIKYRANFTFTVPFTFPLYFLLCFGYS